MHGAAVLSSPARSARRISSFKSPQDGVSHLERSRKLITEEML
jgi:hypothetical protein